MVIYENQSYFDIELDTEIDLSSASSVKINYKKPSGAVGSWTGTASGTIIAYTVQNNDINQSGIWRLQGEFVIGGRTGFTDPVDMVVKKEFEG